MVLVTLVSLSLPVVSSVIVVTMIAVIIGASIGAVCSVPVTNALLQNQIESQSNQQTQIDNNFGRPGNMGGGMQMPNMPNMPDASQGNNPFGNGGMNFPGGDFLNEVVGNAANYVTEIDSAVNLTVILQMIGIGLLLTLIASMVSVLFVMRYNPLKILANRD